MKVLFIAPLPPPVNGHSVVSQHLLEHLRTLHEVTVVNIRKQSLKDGVDSPARIVEVIGILYRIYRQRRDAEVVYLTISESLAGNLRDLIVCLLCHRLQSKMYIHLHGGSLRKVLYERHKGIYWMNKVILRKLAGAIVSGPSHIHIFDGIIDPNKVHVAANFAEDNLFSTERQVIDKFVTLTPIRILYISHMTEKKGYKRLAEAFVGSGDTIKNAISIDFAGAFESEEDKRVFLEEIRYEPHVRYHGVVDDETKRSLFQRAHVLCLPTSFLEGQPISILEAYAAGCAVLATGQPGIRDVFTDGDNGYELTGNRPEDIARALGRIVAESAGLQEIAMHNQRLADEKYRASTSLARIKGIIEKAMSL